MAFRGLMVRYQRNGWLNKILVLDIETKPAVAYTFQAYDTSISPDQVIENGGMICFAAKWVGSKHVMFASEWGDGKLEMLTFLRNLLDEADAVVTYHGDGFDLPIVRGEILMSGLLPFAPVTSIDLLKTVKKFKFFMNKLAFVGPLLGVGAKMKHEGFGLWRAVMEGDTKAQKRMMKYNVQDVIVTENLYKRIRPFIENHPHLGDDRHACGNCGSNNQQMRGWRRTKFFKTRRLQCQDCGAWSSGTRVKV
jgi:hypothetical protein